MYRDPLTRVRAEEVVRFNSRRVILFFARELFCFRQGEKGIDVPWDEDNKEAFLCRDDVCKNFNNRSCPSVVGIAKFLPNFWEFFRTLSLSFIWRDSSVENGFFCTIFALVLKRF